MKILVVDAYPDEATRSLVAAGASCGGSQPLSTVLRDVVEVRILSSESPSWLGDQAEAAAEEN